MTRYLFQENADLMEENAELKRQLDGARGLVTVGNKQFTQALEKINELEKQLEQAHYDNKELEDKLDMVCKQYNSLLKHHNDILKSAKEGLDSYEFCLQDLEKENERLKQELSDNGIWEVEKSEIM